MSSNGVSVSYEPFKEIVTFNKTRFNTAEDLARFTALVTGGKAVGLYWVDGVVFLYFPLNASNTIVVKDLLERGRIYWTFLGFAPMPKYAPTIETKERMIVAVMDLSSDPTLRGVAEWIKTQL